MVDLLPVEALLETERLALEPLVIGHAAAIYAYLRDERIYTFIPQDPPVSLAALEARFRKLATRRSPDGGQLWLNWVARTRGAPVDYIGTVQVTAYADRTAMLAYMIFAPFQRRGYAHEACAGVLDHLTRAYGINRVAAEIDTRNAASIALVRALGFQRVALRTDADFFKGASSDEYHFERELGAAAPRSP